MADAQVQQLAAQVALLQQQLEAVQSGQQHAGPRSAGYLEKPLQEPEQAYLHPGAYPEAKSAGRFPTDGVGRQGEPYHLRLSDDPVYDYALLKGRLHQGLVYRSSASVAAYQELTMLAAAETQRSLMESVAKVAALEEAIAQEWASPVAAAGAGAAATAAVESAASRRMQLLTGLTELRAQLEDDAAVTLRATNTERKVHEMLTYSVTLQQAELGPPHLIPEPLEAAIKSDAQATGAFVSENAHIASVMATYRTQLAVQGAKDAAKRAAHHQNGRQGDGPDGDRSRNRREAAHKRIPTNQATAEKPKASPKS